MNDRERLAHIEQAARNMEGEASMIARLAAELRGRVEEQADSPIAPDVPSARPGEGLGTEGSNPSPASPVKPCPDVPFGSLGNDVEETLDSLLGFAPHPENPHAILPAFGTVFIGVLAGRISRDFKGWGRLGMLTVLGAGTLGLGLALAEVVPITKYLWTPSFALVTGGIAVLALVVLALLIPPRSKGGPLRPLVVLGGHAIVVYAFSETVVARAHGDNDHKKPGATVRKEQKDWGIAGDTRP